MERLQKRIANLGYCSRRKAEELIIDNKVKVNGNIVNELGYKVKISDEIEVEGNLLDNNKSYENYLLYKPTGVITSTKDEKERKTVIDLIMTNTRIYPVGRLDYDTTGVLLLTNDGELANLLMHPSKKIEKTYQVKVEGLVLSHQVKQLRSGVVIEGKKTLPAKVKLKKYIKKSNKSILEITIYEGRNHQVKNMFEAINHKVVKLKRIRYANIDLMGLKEGEYRRLTPKEVAKLYNLTKSDINE